MRFGQSTYKAFGNLYEELNAMLSAGDEAHARASLFQALRLRPVAGASFFQTHQVAGKRTPEVSTSWGFDFSGELDGDCPSDILGTVIENIPDWLVAWLASRKTPFWFFRHMRFIPFSGRLLLDSTAPPGKRQLADFVLTPYLSGTERYFVFTGLHQPAGFELVQELSSLSMAYASRAVNDLSTPGHTALPPAEVSLTERQLQCLQWLAAGKSLQEIALITGMSYANVRYHLDRAKRINGYTSVQQLMVHAAQTHKLSPLGPEQSHPVPDPSPASR